METSALQSWIYAGPENQIVNTILYIPDQIVSLLDLTWIKMYFRVLGPVFIYHKKPNHLKGDVSLEGKLQKPLAMLIGNFANN